MRVAACQTFDVLNDVARALAELERRVVDAEADGARLVLFPECFLQGYDVRAEHVRATAMELDSSEFIRIQERFAGFEPTIVFGLIEKAAGEYFNSAIALQRGVVLAHHRKAHLIGHEKEVFTAGIDYSVFDVDGTKVGINICYDLQFPEAAAAVARAGARLLVCPCNNMLRRERAEEWKLRHNAIRCERARETGLWLLSSDVAGERGERISYGPTALIDPEGGVVEQLPLMAPGVLLVDVPTP